MRLGAGCYEARKARWSGKAEEECWVGRRWVAMVWEANSWGLEPAALQPHKSSLDLKSSENSFPLQHEGSPHIWLIQPSKG